MKLLLCSQGLTTPEISGAFLRLMGKGPKGARIGYIPTAGEAEKDCHYQEEERQGLVRIGGTVEDISLRDPEQVRSLHELDAVMVGGGNTFYLLHWMRVSGAAEILIQRAASGMLYAGISAGSIVAGTSIAPASWKGVDRADLAPPVSLEGLKLFPGLIFPHFSARWVSLIDEERPRLKEPLYCLNDRQALLVEDGIMEII